MMRHLLDFGPYTTYIWLAYGLGVGVLAGTFIYATSAHRRLLTRLQSFHQKGQL